MSQFFGSPALDRIANDLREAFAGLGAQPIDTEEVQPLTPYLEFLGEFFRDTLVEYTAHGQDEYCLRPDITLAIALRLANGTLKSGRYGYDDLVFRGARRARRGDAESFAPLQRQIGIEVFGEDGGDAELLLHTIQALKSAGAGALQIVVSDVALVHEVIDGFTLHANWKQRLKRTVSTPSAFGRVLASAQGASDSPSALASALSGLTEKAARDAVEEVFTMTGLKQIGSRSLADVTDRLVAKAAEASEPLTADDAARLSDVMAIEGPLGTALEQFAGMLRAPGATARLDTLSGFARVLEDGGLSPDTVRFDADLSRHLSYYDGFVFEIFDASGERFLAGGGRYDGLVSALSGGAVDLPAIGAMVRPDRVFAIAGED
ncbi:MAG: ATP phosphoribosyltransferase regulatory subunit [Pseudomonadota bacterium]